MYFHLKVGVRHDLRILFYPICAKLFSGNIWTYLHRWFISLRWHKWLNLSLWKAMTHCSHLGNVLATDVLVTKGARASAAMSKTLFFRNITVSAPKLLTFNKIWKMKSVQSYTVSDNLICFSDTCQSLLDCDSQCMALQPEKWTQYASITVTVWPCGTLCITKLPLMWCYISVNVLNVMGLTL